MQATNIFYPSGGISAFAFDEELRDVEETEVAVVDCGGGRGDFLRGVREKWPHIKGRFILQDLPGVLASVTEEVKGSGVECMGYDFFSLQPVKGGLIPTGQTVI